MIWRKTSISFRQQVQQIKLNHAMAQKCYNPFGVTSIFGISLIKLYELTYPFKQLGLFQYLQPFTKPGIEIVGKLASLSCISAFLQFITGPQEGVKYCKGTHLLRPRGLLKIWAAQLLISQNIGTPVPMPIRF